MRLYPLILLLYLGCASSVRADEVVAKYPLEPPSTTSPRATLRCFLETIREAHDLAQARGYKRGVLSEVEREYFKNRGFGCLDLSQVPPAQIDSARAEAATCLKEVLDRIELPPELEWPDEAAVAADGIERWTIPHTEITIAQVQTGPQQGEFVFSPETVARAADFYERVRHLPYQDRPTVTPDIFRFYHAEPGWMLPRDWIRSLPLWAHRRPGGQAVWQWIGLGCVLLVSLLLMLAAYLVGMRRTRSARNAGLMRYLMTLVFPLTAMIIPLLAISLITNQLRITGDLLVVLTYFLDVVFLFALIMLVLGSGNRLSALINATPWIKPGGLDAQFVRLACRVLSIIAAVVILLEGGQHVGIPLTTLVAGAGVGGLALALAAQDTLKNVFGSIMISLDKPYRVGERIIVKGYDGVVEEVGLRSTKIRLLTGHLTTIPNEEMARSDIENIGRRPHIRRISDIPIPLDTPAEKIERAVDIVGKILDDHEGMDADFPPRVFFNDFNRDSFNIRIILWYHPAAYWDFLAFSQDVNQRIVEAFETDGITFAPPTNVTYLAQPDDQPFRLDVEDRADKGALDRLLYERKLLDQDLPFESLKQQSWVNDIANRAPADRFGDYIRRELPGYRERAESN